MKMEEGLLPLEWTVRAPVRSAAFAPRTVSFLTSPTRNGMCGQPELEFHTTRQDHPRSGIELCHRALLPR
jgi:hypothetical protein